MREKRWLTSERLQVGGVRRLDRKVVDEDEHATVGGTVWVEAGAEHRQREEEENEKRLRPARRRRRHCCWLSTATTAVMAPEVKPMLLPACDPQSLATKPYLSSLSWLWTANTRRRKTTTYPICILYSCVRVFVFSDLVLLMLSMFTVRT